MSETQFDPSEHNVDDVNAYLKDADADERERVLKAEAEGKDRSTVQAPADDADQGDDGATPGLDTGSADTFQEAAAKATEASGEAYEKGYFGHVPSKDGDNPEDLSVAGVVKAAEAAKAARDNQDA